MKAWLEARTEESYSVWLSSEAEFPLGESDTLPMSPSQYKL